MSNFSFTQYSAGPFALIELSQEDKDDEDSSTNKEKHYEVVHKNALTGNTTIGGIVQVREKLAGRRTFMNASKMVYLAEFESKNGAITEKNRLNIAQVNF